MVAKCGELSTKDAPVLNREVILGVYRGIGSFCQASDPQTTPDSGRGTGPTCGGAY